MEFSFNVKITYRDAQAFIDEDPQRVHDRLNKRLFDALAEEFEAKNGRVVVESEPV